MAATIKTFPNGFIVLKNGLVSCSCCEQGFCKFFTLGSLLYVAGFSGTRGFGPDSPVFMDFSEVDLRMDLVGEDGPIGDDSDKPGNTYSRYRACWRFLCREVSVSGGSIRSETNTPIGGPTTTGKNLWNDVCLPIFGPEQQSGTYIYAVNFLGWRQRQRLGDPGRPFDFRPSDTKYDAYKWKITKIE